MTGNNGNGERVERVGYSVREFANAVGCSERHVKNQIAEKKIPCVKLGSRNIIPAGWVRETFALPEHDKAAA